MADSPEVETMCRAAIAATGGDVTSAAILCAIAAVRLCEQAGEPVEMIDAAVRAAIVTGNVRRG